MSHPVRDAQFVEQLQKPSHRAGGFEPDQDRRRQGRVEFPHGPFLVFQRLLDDFPGLAVQHRIVCWAACKSHPIILISASFDPSAVSMDTHSLLRPSRGRRRYDISLKTDHAATSLGRPRRISPEGSERVPRRERGNSSSSSLQCASRQDNDFFNELGDARRDQPDRKAPTKQDGSQ
jgi:hypothetical protein